MISEAMKLLEEKLEENEMDINNIAKIFFFGQNPKAHETKAKIDKWNCIKLNNFCKGKETRDWKDS